MEVDCGSTLLPRTDPNRRGTTYQVYICGGRVQHGLDYCDQNPIVRAVVDEAMLDELSRSYLDLAETRRRLEVKLGADTTIAQAAVAEADAEAQRADARLVRVQRAFQDGYLEPEDYAQQRRQLIEERDAAHAAVERAKDHAPGRRGRPRDVVGPFARGMRTLVHVAAVKTPEPAGACRV
jgi:hypothetical protein